MFPAPTVTLAPETAETVQGLRTAMAAGDIDLADTCLQILGATGSFEPARRALTEDFRALLIAHAGTDADAQRARATATAGLVADRMVAMGQHAGDVPALLDPHTIDPQGLSDNNAVIALAVGLNTLLSLLDETVVEAFLMSRDV